MRYSDEYETRKEYLDSLTLEFDEEAVFLLSELLGPEEDYDGLISMLEDMY